MMNLQMVIARTVACIAICLGSPVMAAETYNSPGELVAAKNVKYATMATMLSVTHAAKRLVAVGDHGVILLSDDGGKKFRQAQNVPSDLTLTSVSFADEKNGLAVGHGGIILRTADGGESWNIKRSDLGNDRPLFAVLYIDSQNVVAVGLWSMVLVSGDGGETWKAVDVSPSNLSKKADLNLFGLFSNRHGEIFAVGEHGVLMRSNDKGSTWNYIYTDYKGSFWTGLALDDGSIIVGGLRGSLFRTTDDGLKWSRIDISSKSSITSLVAEGNRVLGAGLDGLLIESKDSGLTFKTEIRKDRASLTSIVLRSNMKPILFSRQGLLEEPPAQ